MGWDRADGMRAAFAILLMAAVCLGSGITHAQTPVRFSLDWRWEGPAAPFAVALDKGYFKAEGLDVTVVEPSDVAEHHPEAVVGYGYEPGVLDRAGIERAVGFVAGTDNDTTNLSLIAAARWSIVVPLMGRGFPSDVSTGALRQDLARFWARCISRRGTGPPRR